MVGGYTCERCHFSVKKEKPTMKRFLSVLLCVSVLCTLFPVSAVAASTRGVSILQAHEDCAHSSGGQSVTATSFVELKNAIEGGSGEDILLSARAAGEARWTATGTITVSRTVHLIVAEGQSVTLTRGSNANYALFQVNAGGRLILGNGNVEYTGDSLKEAAEQGGYTVNAEDGGSLILDGGAVWENGTPWAPGANFGDSSGKSAVLYGEDGVQYLYKNTGTVSYRPLMISSGSVDIWDGVSLQNNAMIDGNTDASRRGSAVQSNGAGSVLNLYGGEISGCVVATSNSDTGRGAVFVGNFDTSNWDKVVTPVNAHFNMYGGKITRNAASGGGNQDGGGVSVEQGYMDLYGGEISYNHAGVFFNGNSGDGGGIMVRNYAQFHMWGGSVDHNFAGGYGGGIVAWNGEVHIRGGEVVLNKAAYGGGLAISSCNNQKPAVSSKATMHGGLIASNEAINTSSAASYKASAGVGGGICVGSGTRTMGSTLELTGGEIRQNTAQNGGGMGVYAGGEKAEGNISNTAVTMAGDFRLASNFADSHGNGMYISNTSTGNAHYLVKLSGGARIDTNNPVYFENLCVKQVPVQVSDTLTGEGTVAIFEFSDSFWNGTSGSGYDKAVVGREVVRFEKNVQENKIALESTAWALSESGSGLALQNLSQAPLYTIRNGTPVKAADGAVYYRLYAQLSDAFDEAQSGDILYIYYNTTVDTPARLTVGKSVTLMAESTSSAGRDASLSGNGRTKTCWLETTTYGYDVMRGNFYKYVGSGGQYDFRNGTAVTGGKYTLDVADDGATSYNIRNDYTITLSKQLYLGETGKRDGTETAQPGAVIVDAGASLEIGQISTAGMGAGALTFDGNLSTPKEGAMFQVSGTMKAQSGVTIKNHSNYSLAHPGVIEVCSGGSLTMEEGVTVTGNVSPVAGAVYVAQGGSFTMNGGSLTENTGAMPRYGFFTAGGTRLTGYDTAYWGQGKYYSGAGAVYNLGTFVMNGGTVSGNRGEYGALANLGGSMTLAAQSITGNRALRGTGSGEDSLGIAGYTEGALPAIPQENEYSTDAGSGGGLYQGGGSLTVGSGMSITGNTAQNGGGVAVGSGKDIVRTISGYAQVAGGYECGDKTAREPRYNTSTATVNTDVTLTISSGAAVTDNTAEKIGGGVSVTDSGNTLTIENGVSLRRNTAGQGGGAAAAEGGSLTFSNELTDNTARQGGGVYAAGSTVTAKGSLTSNEAINGGGAYVDKNSELYLDGALVNNNRLTGTDGFGVGVYSDGRVTLTAVSGSQPSISYNDRIYLAQGRVASLDASYDITRSGQNGNNKLTLESERTENGTAILQAADAAQAVSTIQSGFITHYTHPLAQKQGDGAVLEINAVPVYYYDRFKADGDLESHCVEAPYAQGDTVIFQNFSVGENYDFQSPSGKSFLYWVTIDANGNYLDGQGDIVDDYTQAQAYYAGNTIQNISTSIYLEAVYGNVQYRATLQVLNEAGDVVTSGTQPMGTITLGGASYNSATGEYSYAMDTPMTVNADPITEAGRETVLQGITVYREMAPTESHWVNDIRIGSSWWRLVAETVMESEELDVPGNGIETVISTGKIKEVQAKEEGTTVGLDEEGRFTYTASSANILVRAKFKPAMVRLEVYPDQQGVREYEGYYNTVHEAVTAVAQRLEANESDRKKHYTITLLRSNSTDKDGNGIVLYYGENGKDPDKCVDNEVVDHLSEGDTVHIIYDLNGYTLDYQHFGERNLKWYDMTVRSGAIVYHGTKDGTYDENSDPENRGPIPSVFRVADGTLNLEGVTVRTTEKPAEGNNDQVYSAKVMEKGTLNIGRGCILGDVFVYTDRDTIGETRPDGNNEGSGHVTVTDTFLEGRTELVATLCLRYWDFENQVRQVIRLDDALAAREGVSIRRMFDLKDVSRKYAADEAGEERYWFIGTDGRLYKKAALVVPDLALNGTPTPKAQAPLRCYWDYTSKGGKPEIGSKEDSGADNYPAWIEGYPFYYDYISTYGFSTADNQVTIMAQLMDGKGEPLAVDRGSVSFVISRMARDENGQVISNRRSYSGNVGMMAGAASLDFPTLAELQVTEEPDLVSWEAPNNYYILSATWSGSGQYAARYAEYWNYAQSGREEHAAILGGTLTGVLRLSVQPKELSAEDIRIQSMTPDHVEYVGPEGRARGNTSSPTVGRVVDGSLGQTMLLGTDYNIYYAALTQDSAKAVRDSGGQALSCEYDGETYYYLAGENGGKIYYSIGGAGLENGTSPTNAMDLNGAPAGSYSVALEAETLPDSNYTLQSGWKDTLFTIDPYNDVLSMEALNHVVVEPGQSYSEVLSGVFKEQVDQNALTITDHNGNELALENCAFHFLPVSGKAELDEEGWPKSEGLYNLEVTAAGHDAGTMKYEGLEGKPDPNYAATAAGYRTILITSQHLNVFFVPETVSVSYTGEIYNSNMLKALDGKGSGGYQVWRCEIDSSGRPVNESGDVISVEKIPTQGKDRYRLDTAQYRLEIGSPRNTPQDVGNYTMVVTDITGSYVGIGTLRINTEQFDMIQLSETSVVYTGVDHSPDVMVRDGKGNELALNRDYVLRITNEAGAEVNAPVNAGTYTYTAQGINNYSGSSASARYTVVPKNLSNSDVTEQNGVRSVILDAPNYAIFTGTPITPRYALYYNGISLVRGDAANADYTQTITEGGHTVDVIRAAGTYTFTITGKGNYTGTTSFTLMVAGEAGTLQIANTDEYTYNGSDFASYRWQDHANVTLSKEGAGTLTLNADQFDIQIQQVSGVALVDVPADAALDAGVYLLTLRPTADYVQLIDGLSEEDFGTCVFQIQRRPVTIKVAESRKLYGEGDPDWTGLGYTTDLVGSDPRTGFFARDNDSITGRFSRNTGEDVRNGGYRYTLGSFSAGSNYVLSVELGSVFEIFPQDISEPTGGQTDLFRLEKRENLSYTGYGLQPVQSMTYRSQRGDLALAEQASYDLNYEHWRSGGENCMPDCREEHDHGWESMAGQPTDVGWYRVTLDADRCITTPDNYVGRRSFLFEIRAQGGELEMRVEGSDEETYQKAGYTPVVTVSREGFELNQDYYTLTYSFVPAGGGAVQTGGFVSGFTQFTNAGVYTIYAAGNGNYTGSAGSVTFTVLPKNIGEGDEEGGGEVEARLVDSQSFTYNGQAQQAEVTASYEGTTLTMQRDYTLSYQNHVNAGTATVILTGQGNYTGTRQLTYPINKQPLTVRATGARKIYGSADPAYGYQVTDQDGKTVSVRLTGAAGRTVGEDVGGYPLSLGTLSAGDNYALTMEAGNSLVITKKSLGDGNTPAQNISPQAPSYVAADTTTAGQLKTQLTVTYWAPALGEKKLVLGTDYTVTVTNEKGNTIGDSASLASSGAYTLTIAGTGTNFTGGFQLQVTAVSADSLIALGEGKTLTYRLEPQNQTLTPQTAGGTVLKNCSIVLTANYTRGGQNVTNLSQDEDGSFTVPLTDAGTYTVVVTYTEGSGDSAKIYFGTVTYVVQPKDISAGNALGDGEATLNEPEGDFSYTGQEVYPTNAGSLLVYGGRTIPAVSGGVTNYIVGYSGNVNPGTATATVYGQGNYTGTLTTTFKVGDVRYTVTYDGNNAMAGTVPQDTALYMPGDRATVMGNTGDLRGPEGTVFLGWSDTQLGILSDRGENAIYVSGSSYLMGDGNVTLYAVWATDANKNGQADCDEDKYAVTYSYAALDNCTGNVPVDPNPYLSGAAVTVLTNVGNLALKDYLLLGWVPMAEVPGGSLALNNASDFFNFVSDHSLYSPGRSFSMGSENLTLCAVWGADANDNGTVDWMESEVSFFVSYDANGGAGTIPASTALASGVLGVTVAPDFESEGLKYPGHTLLGWSDTQHTPLTEAPDEALQIYQPGDLYTIIASTLDPVVVFYAVWAVDENENGTPDYEESRYTITYANACTAVDPELPASETGKLSGLTVYLPAASGTVDNQDATFLGWTAVKEKAEELYSRGEAPEDLLTAGTEYTVTEENVTLYAVWGETNYNVARYSVTVTPVPAAGGEVTATATTVLSGGSSEINITVRDGYALGQVVVNGNAVSVTTEDAGRTAKLTLDDITENKAVVVTFVRSQLRVVWPNAVTYNQTRQAPELRVYKSDDTATEVTNDNYTLSVIHNGEEAEYGTAFVDAGSYTITVTGNGEYDGSEVQVPYTINPALLTELLLKTGDRPYKGTAYNDEIDAVKAGKEKDLTVPESGYIALYSNNVNVGTATVSVVGQGNYTGTLTQVFTITAATGTLTASWAVAPSITYDGRPHSPAPAVKQGENALTENLDYTLTYPEDVTSAGEKKIVVTGKGNFAGAAKELTYTIKAKSLRENDTVDNTVAVLSPAIPEQSYTGSALTPEPVLTYGTAPVITLTKGTDYTLAYENNTEVGEATVTVTGKGNYTGTRTLKFKIAAAGSALTAASSVTKTYNGQGQLLDGDDLKVKAGETLLALDTDYTAAYAPVSDGASLDNGAPKTAGTYVVTITATGSYSGTAQTTFIIAPALIDALTTGETSFTYDGGPHAPEITEIKAGSLGLTAGDYTVVYKDSAGAENSAVPTEAGTYSMIVTGVGNFTGKKTVSFTISAGKTLSADTPANQVYNGLPYQPHPQVKAGNRVLTENTDYTLAYPDDVTNAGAKAVSISGAGNYNGASGSFAYSITAKDLSDTAEIQVYIPDQVYDGTAKTPSPVVTYRTKDGRTLLLTEGNTRDFTVEFSANTATGTATVTLTGHGNYTGTRTQTFQITAAAGKNLTVTATPASFIYNGSEQTPTVTVKDGNRALTEGVDYTLSYTAVTGKLGLNGKPQDAGAYDVVVTGRGNYAGSVGLSSLVITPAALGDTAVDNGTLTYDGSAKTPDVTVKNGDGAVLTEGTDYTLTYQNNTNAGTATVTVTGKGNYAGSRALTFPIGRAKLTITPTKTGKTYGEADGELTYTASVDGLTFAGALTRAPGENVGSYAFTVGTLRETGGNYDPVLANTAKEFTIVKKSIAPGSEGITPSGDLTVGYTGSDFDRAVSTVYQAAWGELSLVRDMDYTVSYTQSGTEVTPNAAGTYIGTVTGKGNYTGSYTFTLTIDNAVLGVAFQVSGGDTVTYNGTDWADGMADRLTASFNGTHVSLTADNLTFRKDGQQVTELTDAGAYTIVVTADSYDTVELPFLILPREIGEPGVTVSGLDGTHTYTGGAQEPPVMVEDGGAALADGTDYDTEYRSNIDAGTAQVVLTGKGNYTGTRTETFTITAKVLMEAEVGSLTDAVYNGMSQEKKPVVTGLAGGVDYELSYSEDLINVGTVNVTVTGKGNYSGTVTRSYRITPKAIQKSWLTVSPSKLTYTGSALTPLVLVADGSVRLIEGTDYELTYESNTAAGTAKAIVKGKGNYQGEVFGTFEISANAGDLAVALNNSETIYNGADQKPALTVSAGGTDTGDYTAVYSYNGGEPKPFNDSTQMVEAGVYTITVTGTGNYDGATAMTVFVIRPAAFTVGAIGEQNYTGGPVTPKPVVTGNNGKTLVEDQDYLLSYANNVALGENTASVTVTGLGNYAGTTLTAPFTITGKNTLFHVTYDGNGQNAGTAPADERGYLAGERAAVLSGTGLVRNGAVFLGWSLTRSDLVTSLAGQQALTILRPGSSLAVEMNLTLYAVWAQDKDHDGRPDYSTEVTITASAGEGGTITPNGKKTVAWGTERVKYEITVQSGYTFSSLTVDGQKVALSTPEAPTGLTKDGSGYTYIFTDVREDHVILVTFNKNSGGGDIIIQPPAPGPVSPDISGIDRYLIIGDHSAYIVGRAPQKFVPNGELTRAEAAAIIYRLLKNKDVPITASFVDVPEKAWYSTAVRTLASMGLVMGVGHGRFEPERNITRQEFAAIISRMAYTPEITKVRDYTDVKKTDWFYDSIQLMNYYGWMVGYPDGTFGVNKNISRAEAVKVFNSITYRLPDQNAIDNGEGNRFNDVTKGHWAYYEIIEAATTHDFAQENGTETWTKTPLKKKN